MRQGPMKPVDSIVIAAQIIDSIQSLVTRETDSLEPKVITVGEILGGTAPNVIAGKTRMQGDHPDFNRRDEKPDLSSFRRTLQKDRRSHGWRGEC